jgi:hypothetical protein
MRRAASALAAATAALSFGCASAFLPPPQHVLDNARATRTFSAELRVSLKGPTLRARTRALIAFQRPDAVRLEVPGPGGLRLVAVTRLGTLWAVFPKEQSFYSGPAEPEELEALLGISLSPAELMDVLVGTGSPRLLSYRTRWGSAYPSEVQATLPDGARLRVWIKRPLAGEPIPERAFEPPFHEGWLRLEADEARQMWGG